MSDKAEDKPVEKPAEKPKQAARKSDGKSTVTNHSGYTIDFAGTVISSGASAELVLDLKKPFVKALIDAKTISIE